MLRAGMLAYAAIFALFPVVSWMARSGSVGIGVWMVLVLQAAMFPTAMMISSKCNSSSEKEMVLSCDVKAALLFFLRLPHLPRP